MTNLNGNNLHFVRSRKCRQAHAIQVHHDEGGLEVLQVSGMVTPNRSREPSRTPLRELRIRNINHGPGRQATAASGKGDNVNGKRSYISEIRPTAQTTSASLTRNSINGAARKRPRQSDPGPDINRVTKPRRSLPATRRTILGIVAQEPQQTVLQFRPLAQTLDKRLQRRLKRRNLSEETNRLDAEMSTERRANTTRYYEERERRQAAEEERDQLQQQLAEQTFSQQGGEERYRELQNQIDELTKKLEETIQSQLYYDDTFNYDAASDDDDNFGGNNDFLDAMEDIPVASPQASFAQFDHTMAELETGEYSQETLLDDFASALAIKNSFSSVPFRAETIADQTDPDQTYLEIKAELEEKVIQCDLLNKLISNLRNESQTQCRNISKLSGALFLRRIHQKRVEDALVETEAKYKSVSDEKGRLAQDQVGYTQEVERLATQLAFVQSSSYKQQHIAAQSIEEKDQLVAQKQLQLENLNAQLAECHTALAKRAADIAHVETQLVELRGEIMMLKLQEEASREEITGLMHENDTLISDRKFLKDKLTATESAFAELEEAKKGLEAVFSLSKVEITGLKEAMQELGTANTTLTSQLQTKTKEVEVSLQNAKDQAAQLTTLQASLINNTAAIEEAHSLASALSLQAATYRIASDNQHLEIEKLKESIIEKTAEHINACEKIAALKVSLASQTEQYTREKIEWSDSSAASIASVESRLAVAEASRTTIENEMSERLIQKEGKVAELGSMLSEAEKLRVGLQGTIAKLTADLGMSRERESVLSADVERKLQGDANFKMALRIQMEEHMRKMNGLINGDQDVTVNNSMIMTE